MACWNSGPSGEPEAEARAEQGRLNQPEGLTKEQIRLAVRRLPCAVGLQRCHTAAGERTFGGTWSRCPPGWSGSQKPPGDKPAEAGGKRPARSSLGTGDKLCSEERSSGVACTED